MTKQANNPIGLSNRTVSRRKFLQLAGAALAAAVLPPALGWKPATAGEIAELTAGIHWVPWADDGTIWYIAGISEGNFEIADGKSRVEVISVASTNNFHVGDQIMIG